MLDAMGRGSRAPGPGEIRGQTREFVPDIFRHGSLEFEEISEEEKVIMGNAQPLFKAEDGCRRSLRRAAPHLHRGWSRWSVAVAPCNALLQCRGILDVLAPAYLQSCSNGDHCLQRVREFVNRLLHRGVIDRHHESRASRRPEQRAGLRDGQRHR